jgi:hypothetical protein
MSGMQTLAVRIAERLTRETPHEFVLGLPNEEYHKNAPGISNSLLKEIDPTPQHLLGYLWERELEAEAAAAEAERTGEPVVSDSERIEHFLVGSLVHQMTLEPDSPLPKLVTPPQEYPSVDGYPKDWNWNAKYCKQWRAEERRKGNIVLTQKAYDQARGCVRGIIRHPIAAALLRRGNAEVSAFAPWVCGHKTTRRTRMDWLPDADCIVDIKTVLRGGAERGAFQKTCMDYGYGEQAAYYLDVYDSVRDYAGQVLGDWPYRTAQGAAPAAGINPDSVFRKRTKFVFIVVEKEPPYACNVFFMENDFIERGRERYISRLTQAAEACATGFWPGYGTEWIPLPLPAWARSREVV